MALYQQPQQIQGLRQVSSINDVHNTSIPFGQSVAFVETDRPLLYIKTAELNGMTYIRSFKIEPYVEETPQYVTKQELQSMFDELKGMISRESDIRPVASNEPDAKQAVPDGSSAIQESLGFDGAS